jgi:acetyl esterase/lipase
VLKRRMQANFKQIGGGYVQPASPAHFNYLYDLINVLNKQSAGPKISVLVLAYTLAPDAEFPTQLSEATSLISYLTKTLNRSPSSLIVAGDSAGGNLVLSLISHILHPHPSVPTLELNAPFKAVFLLSPWVSFSTEHPSFTANAETDIFDHIPLTMWAKAFLGNSQRQGIVMGNSYSEPLLAEPSWWSGSSKVANEILFWTGGGELFYDGIRAFAEKFSEGWSSGGGERQKVQLLVGEKMAHEEMVLDIILGMKTKGQGALQVEEWVKSKL